jgi:hypothetical protein
MLDQIGSNSCLVNAAFWLWFLGEGKGRVLDRVRWLCLGRLGSGWAGRLILSCYYHSIIVCAIVDLAYRCCRVLGHVTDQNVHV